MNREIIFPKKPRSLFWKGVLLVLIAFVALILLNLFVWAFHNIFEPIFFWLFYIIFKI